jgi:hypothetical protein
MSVQEEIDRHERDALFVQEHREELLRQFPETWIAVYDRRIVGAAKELPQLIEQVKQKGIRPGRTYREFLTDNDDLLIVFSDPE